MAENLTAQQIVDALNARPELWTRAAGNGFQTEADVLVDRLYEMGVFPERDDEGRFYIEK